VRGQLPAAVAAPAAEMIDGARAALPAMPGTTASLIDDEQPLAALARAYMRTLLGGYRQAASRLVFDAAERGEPIGRLYLHVLQPALREVGRLWQTNRINVGQEHFCSASTQVVMSQLLPHAIDERRRGRRIVVACIGGELHDVGARMVGDFFEMDGWEAYFCGADTPQRAIGEVVVERAADVLAVSATMGHRLHAVQDLVERMRADPRCAHVRILVGGHPFGVDPALWRTVGADGSAPDAAAAVELANRWPTGAGPAA
jgi:methanogenic corrinoid protein MtbC1